MKNNINCVTEEKNKCFGCRACANICPVQAITMQEDDEGFFYPVVDESKCTNCGLCKKTCPSLQKSETFLHNTKSPECLAVMADDELRLKSSSGGAFSLIANKILEQGGYVCGVAFDEKAQVKHIIIDNNDDLAKLRGSKYVQSNTNTVYSEIKKLLDNNKKVLFTGTPCQVAGLNTFLKKNYDNLYTVDLICHGVPPQKVFDMYLKEVTNGKFVNTNFRDKVTGWDVYTTTTTTTGVFSFTKEQCLYLNAFLKNMCLRPSCGTCPYTNTQREADITIGDFWAIERFDKKLNDKNGISMVLLNNLHGKKLFSSIENNMPVSTEVPLEYATYYNWTLYRTLPQHPNRKAFFRLLSTGKSLREATDYCLNNRYDCAILGVWPYKNYGSSLTSYALQEIITELGYSPKVINYHTNLKGSYSGSFSEIFANKYLNLTKWCRSYTELDTLNKETSTFVIGSDCMWHPGFFQAISKEYPHFLSFAAPEAKKLAYATSFGTYDKHYDSAETNRMKYYLQKFDKISTREKAGIDFCKKRFNLNVDSNLDPVFLPSIAKFNKIIEDSSIEMNGKYIAHYIFWPNLATNTMLKCIENKYNLPMINIHKKEELSVADWLYYIKNCELLVTHSFHGLCFAIIFNKPFVLFKIGGFDDNRYMSLLKTLGLENRLLVDVHSIENRPDLFEPIDWDKVNAILTKEKERSLKWLKDALEAPKDLTKINPTDAVIQELNRQLSFVKNNSVTKQQMIHNLSCVSNYRTNYCKYLKYKILKSFVFGKTKDRYLRKQKDLHQKIRIARNIKKGQAECLM